MLKLTCPCGAPYSLGDHLAGRTFQCPQCNRVLKVGQPRSNSQSGSGQVGRQSGTGPAMRQSGTGPASASGRLRQDSGSGELEWGGGSSKETKRPAGGDLDLLPLDDEPGGGLVNSLEETMDPDTKGGRKSGASSRSGRASSDRNPKRTSGSMQARASGSQRAMKTSGSQRAGRASGTGPAAGGGDSGGSHSRECPVCSATIAKIARECPSCGVVLRGPSAGEQLLKSVNVKLLQNLGMLALAAGAVWFGYKRYESQQPQRPQVRLPTPTPSETPTPTATETAAPSATPSVAPSETPTPRATEAPPIIIPGGPLAPDFERLRDAKEGFQILKLAAELASKPGVETALTDAEPSRDAGWRQRVFLVRLRAGDAAARKATLTEAFAKESGERLLHAVATALELDPVGFKDAVSGIKEKPENRLAREWGLACQAEADAPSEEAWRRARDAWDAERPRAETRAVLAPYLVRAMDGVGLALSLEALGSERTPIKELALKGLATYVGGRGPGSSTDAAAWRGWAESYLKAWDALSRLCADPSQPAVAVAGKKAALQLGRACLAQLPIFMRDRAALQPWSGLALGDLLARLGRGADNDIGNLLSELGPERAPCGGFELARGALLGCDKAIAADVARFLVRGGAAPESFGDLPDLIEPADEGSVAPLVQALSDGKLRTHYLLALVALRRPVTPVIDWILGDTSSSRDLRLESGARLGCHEVEQTLLKAIETQPTAGVETGGGASEALGRCGTARVADDVVKGLLGKKGVYFPAVTMLADSKQGKRLRGEVASADDGRWAEVVFKAYAITAGSEAEATLSKRLKEEGVISNLAAAALRLIKGSKLAREEALSPFESYLASDRQGAPPSLQQLKAMLSQATNQDKSVLVGCLKGGLDPGQSALLCLAVGRLGFEDQVGVLRGWLIPKHEVRGAAALGLAALALQNPKIDLDSVKGSLQGVISAALRSDKDAEALGALAVIDPAAATGPAEGLIDVVVDWPAASGAPPPMLAAMAGYALALAGKEDGCLRLLTVGNAQTRLSIARGLAMAATSGRIPAGTMAPVAEQLVLDTDPLIRAYGAVMSGALNVTGAKEEIQRALALPNRVLDAWEDEHMAYLGGYYEGAALRGLLWDAFASCNPKEPPVYEPRWGLGRRIEVNRDLRKR